MPDGTGWDVARWAATHIAPVPIIVISGQPPHPRQARPFHPVAFLAKPFAVGDLLAAVSEHVLRPPPIPGT